MAFSCYCDGGVQFQIVAGAATPPTGPLLPGLIPIGTVDIELGKVPAKTHDGAVAIAQHGGAHMLLVLPDGNVPGHPPLADHALDALLAGPVLEGTLLVVLVGRGKAQVDPLLVDGRDQHQQQGVHQAAEAGHLLACTHLAYLDPRLDDLLLTIGADEAPRPADARAAHIAVVERLPLRHRIPAVDTLDVGHIDAVLGDSLGMAATLPLVAVRGHPVGVANLWVVFRLEARR